MIPNLLIPGAAKSGTSSLHEYLDLHPNIEMSRIKEPHFFTKNGRYKKGLEFYKDVFNNKNVNYWGESSTAYLGDELSQKRIRNDLENVKFIVILREPVKRAISHYRWQVSLLQESRSFRKAVKYNMKNPVDVRKPGWGGHVKAYFEGSLYGKQLHNLIRKFGKENIHVITSKELKSNPNSTLKRCFDFLGLEPIDITVNIKANSTNKIPGRVNRLKKFIAKAVKRGILDLRLLYLAANNKIGTVTKTDKIWLEKNLEEDKELLFNYYPNISERW